MIGLVDVANAVRRDVELSIGLKPNWLRRAERADLRWDMLALYCIQ